MKKASFAIIFIFVIIFVSVNNFNKLQAAAAPRKVHADIASEQNLKNNPASANLIALVEAALIHKKDNPGGFEQQNHFVIFKSMEAFDKLEQLLKTNKIKQEDVGTIIIYTIKQYIQNSDITNWNELFKLFISYNYLIDLESLMIDYQSGHTNRIQFISIIKFLYHIGYEYNQLNEFCENIEIPFEKKQKIKRIIYAISGNTNEPNSTIESLLDFVNDFENAHGQNTII